MAEQAINTIYTLCEHPDVLCNDLIKHLARRVFTPKSNNDEEQITARPQATADPDAMDEDSVADESTPAPEEPTITAAPSARSTQSAPPTDGGDAFELSQLLFVVGHVAVKQIVYLELVEREWKRQKDEKEKGRKFASTFPSHMLMALMQRIN